MSYTEILGLIMLFGMVAVIFIGFPISFTLLFLALVFGDSASAGADVQPRLSADLGHDEGRDLSAVPLFIFMGYMTEQAGLMERLFGALRSFSRRYAARFISRSS